MVEMEQGWIVWLGIEGSRCLAIRSRGSKRIFGELEVKQSIRTLVTRPLKIRHWKFLNIDQISN